MRFPFTFMGLTSLAFAAWIGVFYILHRAGEPELAVAILMAAFGGYLVLRRLVHGRQA